MGVTYKAFDVHLQCPVALKIINARFIGDDSAHLRFVREARAAASVRHPNVASVFHLGESGGNYFYAMEFVQGETLETLIRRSGKLETDMALEVAAQVAAGLTAIQKQHLVHRDIKPSNILVDLEEGRLETAKIIDLGLAKGVVVLSAWRTISCWERSFAKRDRSRRQAQTPQTRHNCTARPAGRGQTLGQSLLS